MHSQHQLFLHGWLCAQQENVTSLFPGTNERSVIAFSVTALLSWNRLPTQSTAPAFNFCLLFQIIDIRFHGATTGRETVLIDSGMHPRSNCGGPLQISLVY